MAVVALPRATIGAPDRSRLEAAAEAVSANVPLLKHLAVNDKSTFSWLAGLNRGLFSSTRKYEINSMSRESDRDLVALMQRKWWLIIAVM
jgi:hypothetical protein